MRVRRTEWKSRKLVSSSVVIRKRTSAAAVL